jgi:hypothetical protein
MARCDDYEFVSDTLAGTDITKMTGTLEILDGHQSLIPLARFTSLGPGAKLRVTS